MAASKGASSKFTPLTLDLTKFLIINTKIAPADIESNKTPMPANGSFIPYDIKIKTKPNKEMALERIKTPTKAINTLILWILSTYYS